MESDPEVGTCAKTCLNQKYQIRGKDMITNKNKKTIGMISFLKKASVLLALLIIGVSPVSVSAFDLFLGTGPEGTFSHFSGKMLARVINRNAGDINCKIVPSSGDIHNLTNIQGGSLDIALIDSRMLYDAFKKAGYFEFLDIRYDNLRILFPLYEIPITLIVRDDAGITSLSGLKGKRLNAGSPRSMQHLAVDTIMAAKNWSKKDFQVLAEITASHSQDRMAFCHGSVQAMVHIGVHPDSSLQQLFRLCSSDLVDMNDSDIEKLVKDNPAFYKINIPENVYSSHPKGVSTFGTKAILIASSDLDTKTVVTIADAIYNSQKQLQQAHPSLVLMPADEALKSGLGVELHPGAVTYFSGQ